MIDLSYDHIPLVKFLFFLLILRSEYTVEHRNPDAILPSQNPDLLQRYMYIKQKVVYGTNGSSYSIQIACQKELSKIRTSLDFSHPLYLILLFYCTNLIADKQLLRYI